MYRKFSSSMHLSHLDVTKMPMMGRWLMDLDVPDRDYSFHLLDVFFYPRVVNAGRGYGTLCNKVTDFPYVVNRNNYIYGRETRVDSHQYYGVRFDAPYVMEKTEDIIRFARKEALKVANVSSPLVNVTPASYQYKASDLDPELLKQRQFYLRLAMEVVCCSRSVEEVAEDYGVGEENIRIWISLFLNRGYYQFLKPPILFDDDDLKKIADDYHRYNKDIVTICTLNQIYTRNHLKHLLKKYYKSANR